MTCRCGIFRGNLIFMVTCKHENKINEQFVCFCFCCCLIYPLICFFLYFCLLYQEKLSFSLHCSQWKKLYDKNLNWRDTVNCTSSGLPSSLAYRLPVTVQRTVPPIFRTRAWTCDTCTLPGSSTHTTFLQLLLHKCPCICGSQVCRAPSGTAWLHWPFCTCGNFWNQNFMGATIHENWISWKFSPWNISPTKISTSTVIDLFM